MSEFHIPVKSASGVFTEPMSGRFFLNREVWLTGRVDEESAVLLVKQLMLLGRENETEPITLFINSGGGSIRDGLLIYDAIRDCAAPVRTFCCGDACSMAAVLAASGTGGRYINPHGRMMLHEPLLGEKVGGNVSSIREISKSLEKAKEDLDVILSGLTGKSLAEIAEATASEHYYSAQEAVDFGLVDKILPMRAFRKGEK